MPDPNLLDSVLSDGDSGDFCFEDIQPASYVLVEQQPANYSSVQDFDETTGVLDPDGNDSLQMADDDIPVVLAPGEDDGGNNFVEDPFDGTISGYISDDLGNPMSNITVALYFDSDFDGEPNGAPIQTTVTVNGAYLFSNVYPGYYVVEEQHPLPWSSISDRDTSVNAGDPDGDDGIIPDENIPVILAPGEDDEDNNFVNGRPGTICGTVADTSGAPIASVWIFLYADTDTNGIADGAKLDSVLSDGDSGSYCFDDIQPGAYVLVEEQPTNYTDFSDFDATPDPDGDDSAEGPDDNIPVVLEPGEDDEENDFIEIPLPATATGKVIDDIGNPLQGITLRIFLDVDQDMDPEGVPMTTVTTDVNGEFSFSGLPPGGYLIVEVQPALYSSLADYDQSPDPDGDDQASGPNNMIPVVLTPGELDTDNDFMEGRPGEITGYVKDDLDASMADIWIRLYPDADGDGVLDGPAIDSVKTLPVYRSVHLRRCAVS